MPGPRKKLAQLHRLDGNPSNRPVADLGVEAYGAPFVPEHLPDDARGCFEVVVRSMPDKVYSALDSFLLSAFVMAWAEHKRAVEEITHPDFEPIVINSAGSQTPSPWYKVLNTQAGIMASLGDRLGLDPKARAALKVPRLDEPTSKFSGLLGVQTGSSRSSNA